ncbi:MAG: hypothetical protein SPF22_06520 [Candidatus Onthovivens sp.]|nr:hypothetical protein [Candidatus Onthovivens sp.]
MKLKDEELEEVVFLIIETVSQFYDDRLFEIYNLNNMFASEKVSFKGYKVEKANNKKEVDVEKVRSKTQNALNKFVNSIKKRGEE